MMTWLAALSLFLLGFSSLFPLINPVGTALLVNHFFTRRPLDERKSFAARIVLYCLALGVMALFLGSWVLKFMGISLATTQMAGGILIARMGLVLLNSKVEFDGTSNTGVRDSLFYPIAFPLTLGPGGISVLITLSAHAQVPGLFDTYMRMSVLTLSLLSVLAITYFCFVYSSDLIQRIGPSGSLILNRLMAFIVFCIGIQMLVIGLGHSFPKLFA